MRGRGLLMKKKWTISMPRKKELNKIHHAARYLSMSNALGAPPWNGQMPVFKVKKEIELIQHEIIEAAEAGKLLLVAPGAAYGPSKMWPSEYFRKICSFWIENGGSVAVSGTHREKETADSVSDGLPRDKTFNLCGKTDLNELIMIIQNAVFCVANDSGIMHLAAVLGTPGIAIFGSTDPTSTSPVSENWQVLYEKMPCSPCFKRDCPRTRDKYECLHRIKPESVMGSLPI
jgi:heptosyltransferase-2